jgi:Holliday junction resolvase-like predicted endonuclease
LGASKAAFFQSIFGYFKSNYYICRFDVVGLEFDLKYPKIDWIKDAFEAP